MWITGYSHYLGSCRLNNRQLTIIQSDQLTTQHGYSLGHFNLVTFSSTTYSSSPEAFAAPLTAQDELQRF